MNQPCEISGRTQGINLRVASFHGSLLFFERGEFLKRRSTYISVKPTRTPKLALRLDREVEEVLQLRRASPLCCLLRKPRCCSRMLFQTFLPSDLKWKRRCMSVSCIPPSHFVRDYGPDIGVQSGIPMLIYRSLQGWCHSSRYQSENSYYEQRRPANH